MSVSENLDAATRAASRIAAEHADTVDRENRIPVETLGALRREGFLSLLVPGSLGGQQRPLAQIASTCHALAQACGSSGMIYAMHQIQVACIVAHGMKSDWHRALLARLAQEQLLLGSVTSEVGTGGNIHASVCSLGTAGERVTVEKNATTISYGTASDGLLITTRRDAESAASDQVMVVAMRDDYTLERTSAWDALGMRGTCSEGFRVHAATLAEQVLPVPFADIASQTMLPVSHLLWSSVWLGIASDAVSRARAYLRQQARSGKGTLSPGSHRLARGVGLLQLLQARLAKTLKDYEDTYADGARPLPLGFTAEMNNLKTSVSDLCLEVVQHALMVCGINGYKNGSEFSLGRHIRDLLSAPIMINNDRMLESTGNLLLMQKPAFGVF